MPGRSITDNVMVAFEVMHVMKRKNNGKNGWLSLKLDTSKAYDRVEWLFSDRNDGENGVFDSVDVVGYELLVVCKILFPSKLYARWGGEGRREVSDKDARYLHTYF